MPSFEFDQKPFRFRATLSNFSELTGMLGCVPPTEVLTAFNELANAFKFGSVKLFSTTIKSEPMETLVPKFREHVVGEFFYGYHKKSNWVFYHLKDYEFHDGRKVNLMIFTSKKDTFILTNTYLPFYRAA